jgi:lysophospholipase L1-like esterase
VTPTGGEFNVSLPPANGNAVWVGTWAASPHGPYFSGIENSNITIRQVVRATIGGDRVRIRLSNTFGAGTLLVGSAHIAVHESGARIVAGTDRALTFQGEPSVRIECGCCAISDGIPFDVAPNCDLAVSLYLPGTQGISGGSVHFLSLQTCYLSPSIGDCTGAIGLPVDAEMNFWFALTGVDVRPLESASAIVAIGDCLTDGAFATPHFNRRWANVLATRLFSAKRNISVLNAGIAGNRLLRDGPHPFESIFGPSALTRFDRDVLSQAGARYVIISVGGGDLTHPGFAAPYSETVPSGIVIEGLLHLIKRARMKGLKVIGGTCTPFEGGYHKGLPPVYSATKERKRQEVNEWIRSAGVYDGVIDFDAIVRDPGLPARITPRYDFNDHLHLNDMGHRAVGEAIDLDIFE